MTPEGKVKAYLREECKKRGWRCRVLVATHEPRWPDRGIFSRGKVAWIEVKPDGANLETDRCKGQRDKIKQLIEEGCFAAMVIGKTGVDALMVRMEQWFAE